MWRGRSRPRTLTTTSWPPHATGLSKIVIPNEVRDLHLTLTLRRAAFAEIVVSPCFTVFEGWEFDRRHGGCFADAADKKFCQDGEFRRSRRLTSAWPSLENRESLP